jgi:hypothetical protein
MSAVGRPATGLSVCDKEGGTMDQDQRPQADPHHEEMAAELFGLGFSAEEYAAHFADGWYCFGLGRFRYADPAVDAWILRLQGILSGWNGAPTLEELRQKYCSAEERRQIAQRLEEDL